MIVTLSEAEAWSTVVGAQGIAVRVAAGEVWVTREGDAEDHVVAAPHTFRSDRRGRLAVQALGPARLELSPLRAGAVVAEQPVAATSR